MSKHWNLPCVKLPRFPPQVDVYSFGVVLWEICTGRVPTRGRLEDPAVPGDCPADILMLIRECMQVSLLHSFCVRVHAARCAVRIPVWHLQCNATTVHDPVPRATANLPSASTPLPEVTKNKGTAC